MEAAGRPRFGALLRQFRLDAGMTQQELAERAGLSADAVSTLERGARTRPYRETVVSLGRALDLSPEREVLLESAAGIPPLPRRRGEALNASLLRIVRPDAEETPHNNLPRQLTSFVGRQREISEIAILLKDHRLVTVVGAGGVGKTRIVVQTGNDSLGSYRDGVWLTDLAPLADQTLASSVVLSSLQLPSTTGSPSDVVVAYLKTRRLLLILDNCEHLIAAVRALAARIVQSCPEVRVLATSREALEVPGEDLYRLPSLLFPSDSCARAQDALRYESVALFVDRAHAVNSSFVLTDDNAPDVSEICRRLEGIPLAIELAAARVKVLAPRQIAQRLDQRFRLLTGGDPRALRRHQTMSALIDWSYDLLTPREQTFFESLSVFAGGCTLEAAAAVCAIDGEDDIAVIDLIGSLVTKSLLVAELAGNEQRYRLLESTRQYAQDKLKMRGGQEMLARRHALVYLELTHGLERAWDTMPDREWFPHAQVELANWRVALEWALAKRGDVILGQRLTALPKILWRSFTLAEGRRWVRAALELVDEHTPDSLVARLEHAEASGDLGFGECKAALQAAKRALVRYRRACDVLGSGWAQCLAGGALALLGQCAKADLLLQEALKAGRTHGDRRLAASALKRIGDARRGIGDFTGARAAYTQALGLAQLIGADTSAETVAVSLADCEFLAGDPKTALRLMVDLLAARSVENPTAPLTVAAAHVNAAAYLITLGRYEEARVHANEALELGRRLGLAVPVALSLQRLALATVLRPQIEGRRCASVEHAGAARLFGFATARFTALGADADRALREQCDLAFAVLRESIGADELTHLMADGATMTEDEAIAQGQAL